MRILKILFVLLLIYFIRRFIQMYRVMKSIQEREILNQKNEQYQHGQKATPKDQGVIDADFKVMD